MSAFRKTYLKIHQTHPQASYINPRVDARNIEVAFIVKFIYHETPLITQPSFALLWEAGVLYSRLANSVFGMNFVFYRVLKLEVLIF